MQLPTNKGVQQFKSILTLLSPVLTFLLCIPLPFKMHARKYFSALCTHPATNDGSQQIFSILEDFDLKLYCSFYLFKFIVNLGVFAKNQRLKKNDSENTLTLTNICMLDATEEI